MCCFFHKWVPLYEGCVVDWIRSFRVCAKCNKRQSNKKYIIETSSLWSLSNDYRWQDLTSEEEVKFLAARKVLNTNSVPLMYFNFFEPSFGKLPQEYVDIKEKILKERELIYETKSLS